MSYKPLLLRTFAIILFIIGAVGSYILSAFVFDRSFMMTQGALGAPSTELRLWLMFGGLILLAITGITLFILSFRRKRDQKTNISDPLN